MRECYVRDCPGQIDIGNLLTWMVVPGLLLAFTWPFAIASIVLGAAMLGRWVFRQLAR
jgi:hypothetical protein